MGRLARISLFSLICFWLSVSPSFAQTKVKFGSHLGCFNSPKMIREVRQAYNKAGVFDWVPATVMVTVQESGQFLTALLEAAYQNKIWPILRLDGVPHGARIEKEDIKRLVKSLGEASSVASKFPWPVYIEFGNEPNMNREWGGEADASSYAQSLESFIEGLPPSFAVLNGAMNASLTDPAYGREAVSFWEKGPKRLIPRLDGLAFNPYELWGGGRRGIDSWLWELEKLGNPGKPVFLLEFGLDPNASLIKRKEFLEDQYRAYLGGGRFQLEKVEAITPLFCRDLACQEIEIPIFNFNGKVSFIEPVGGATCGGAEEEEREPRCGEVGAVLSIKGSAKVEECAKTLMQPFLLKSPEDKLSICKLRQWPVIGRFAQLVCDFRINSEDVQRMLIPKEARVSPPPLEETFSLKTGEVGAQLSLNSIVDWLLRVIAQFTVKKEGGHIKAAIPSKFGEEGFLVMEAEGAKGEIVSGFDTLKRAYTPYTLGERPKPQPGVPLPPELEPTPSPLPPGAPTPTPLPSGGLWYRIAHRDSSIVVGAEKREEIISLVLKYWPDSKIRKRWDYVEGRAIKNGWNPAFVIALWIEESGASGVSAWDVGCTGAPQNDLEAGLSCLFGLSYGEREFPEFLCRFSEGHYPCTFSINPNFPKNLKVWYDRLVPPGTPGAAEPL